jgi:hypothetical protein
MIEPTIGRVVWYWPSKDDLDTPSRMVQLDPWRPFDAHIVYVHSSTEVNLVVFDHIGNSYRRTAPINIEDSARPLAEWMPYQIGQAKKQAEEIK